MSKTPKSIAESAPRVRTRRAYFDCRFGQLHVRTAFPTTGGFDEGTTLFCLHAESANSRTFAKFLPEIAADRSVYAPDFPGCGESDAAPASASALTTAPTSASALTTAPAPASASALTTAPASALARSPATNSATQHAAALAIADLAADLRLRQIDILGFRFGAAVALDLAAVKPDLVRRLVLVATPPIDTLPVIKQESLVMRIKLGSSDDAQWTQGALARPTFVDLAEYAADLFEAAPKTLAKRIGDFLKA